MKVLVKGWLGIYHSYAVVNYFQMKYLSRRDDVELYFESVKFYRDYWEPQFENKIPCKMYNGEKVDIIFSIAFPYTILETDTPQVLFYTAEHSDFVPEFYNKSLEDIKQLVENKKLFLLTPSERSAKAFKKYNIPVKVIPHGYDTEVLYQSVNERKETRIINQIPLDAKVFLNVSSMTGNKNILLILLTFYEALKKDNNMYLVLKGNNDLYQSFNLLHNALSKLENTDPAYIDIRKNLVVVCDSLSFDDMRKLYNMADVYIDAGINEGFSIPIVEALACGLPVFLHKRAPLCHLGTETFETTNQLISLFLHDLNFDLKVSISDKYEYTNIVDELINYFRSILY